MADHAGRRTHPCHALGKPRRTRRGLRRAARLSDRLAHPCGLNALRRRQLDDLGRALQIRRVRQREADGAVRAALRRRHYDGRREFHAHPPDKGTGAHSGRDPHAGRPCRASGADAAAPDAVPAADSHSAHPRRLRSCAGADRLRRTDRTGMGAVSCLARVPQNGLRGGDAGVFPVHDGPCRRVKLRAGKSDQRIACNRCGRVCISGRLLVAARSGAGKDRAVSRGCCRHRPAGVQSALWRGKIRRAQLDPAGRRVVPAVGVRQGLLYLCRRVHALAADGEAQYRAVHRLFRRDLRVSGAHEGLWHRNHFLCRVPCHRVPALRQLCDHRAGHRRDGLRGRSGTALSALRAQPL